MACEHKELVDLTQGLGEGRHYYCKKCGYHNYKGTQFTKTQWFNWINDIKEGTDQIVCPFCSGTKVTPYTSNSPQECTKCNKHGIVTKQQIKEWGLEDIKSYADEIKKEHKERKEAMYKKGKII